MGRAVMIVGNGPVGPEASRQTAAADLVVRFNDCRSAGETAARTDIVVVCNTGRPGKKMLEDPSWRAHKAVASAGEIWCVRDPQKFSELRETLAVTHPELDDFCDDYTDAFRAFTAAEGKGFRVVPREVHERLDEALIPLSPVPYVVPSTGLVTIADLIENHLADNDRILLAGFSHQGWEWHPWEAERLYLEPYEASGFITRIRENEQQRPVSGEQG